jgi:RNA polymerase sigma factor (sigma-70 family)
MEHADRIPAPASDDWLAPWVEQWGDRMVQFAYTYVMDRDAAQDIAQETFLRLFLWHRRFPDRVVTPAWLYTVAANRARDVLRERRREALTDRELASPDPADAPDSTTRIAVRAALDRLPLLDRQCLWLFYYADWPVPEIAVATRLSQAAVKQRLYRARKRFARIWGDESRA